MFIPEKDAFYSSIWVVSLWQKQMVATNFFPQSRGVGQKGPARDVKSDTDRSAAPALLCEASCNGPILSESLCGGLGLWPPKTPQYPPSASVSRHQSGLEDKKISKDEA